MKGKNECFRRESSTRSSNQKIADSSAEANSIMHSSIEFYNPTPTKKEPPQSNQKTPVANTSNSILQASLKTINASPVRLSQSIEKESFKIRPTTAGGYRRKLDVRDLE